MYVHFAARAYLPSSSFSHGCMPYVKKEKQADVENDTAD